MLCECRVGEQCADSTPTSACRRKRGGDLVHRFAGFDVGERQQLFAAVLVAERVNVIADGAGNLLPRLRDELARSLPD
jgi:hypothetical protein